MKTLITSLIVLTAAASVPAFADRTKEVTFEFNPNQSVAEIYVDLTETAESVCKAHYKNSVIPSAWPAAIKTCERELLDGVVVKIGNRQLAELHYNGTISTQDSFAEVLKAY
ncbi:MAG: hypothetical protein AAGJ50_03110 [Pseudomonadota bacterium]